MVADDRNNIIYFNDSMNALVQRLSSSINQLIPNFNAAELNQYQLEQFSQDANLQRQLLNSLTSIHNEQLLINGNTIEVTIAPIFNDQQEKIGYVVEWQDLTETLAQQAKERALANENARIRQSLDVANTPVMVADNEQNIIYLNHSIQNLMNELSDQLAQVLPQFNADQLLGSPLQHLYQTPETEISRIEQLKQVEQNRYRINELTLDITATPIFSEQTERLGTVIEWDNITEALAKQIEERRVADENARIKAALDYVSTNAMVADANRKIVYCNQSMQNMFMRNEDKLKAALPDFDASHLVGKNMDQFHQDPAHQAKMLADLTATYQTEIAVNGLTFALTANPVFDSQGQRLGSVVEWLDRTEEVAIEKEIDHLVDAASNGDLTERIDLTNKRDFFLTLATGLNHLVESAQGIIEETGNALSKMSQGDLTYRINQDFSGAFEQLKNDANTTSTKLTEIINGILTSCSTVSTGANEIAQGNLNLSQRTEEQAASLEETAASMDEMTSSVKTNADNADKANQLAKDASTLASDGGQVVKNAINAMSEINQASNEIVDIISTIDEIAFQTNLLALNAAVEAARAGEQGKGFAVVAGEVRNLAQRSADSAKQIKTLIQNSVEKVDLGTKMVNESGDRLNQIIDSVAKVNSIIEAISLSADEQSKGISQVNQAINQMDQMTQQNAALVEEATAASSAMAEQARQMQVMMDFFTTDQSNRQHLLPSSY
nr:methyl-accepting chemotaxis protein [Marinifaba aquimaris]